jgi:hypothetical protein
MLALGLDLMLEMDVELMLEVKFTLSVFAPDACH